MTDEWGTYWERESLAYRAALASAYHQERLLMVAALVRPTDWEYVVDFGCGDGCCLSEPVRGPTAPLRGWAIDADSTMIAAASSRLGTGSELVLVEGGVEVLQDVPTGIASSILAINVLAYMSAPEVDRFYSEAHRILQPGGALIETHSNELFDLFSLNAFTVSFFGREFGSQVGPLLRTATSGERATYPTRANPLKHETALRMRGFKQVQTEFAHHHSRPPGLTTPGESASYDEMRRPISPLDSWKMLFQCSIFGSRSVRV